MFLRLSLFLILIFSVFFLPLPVVLFLFAILAVAFSNFWEGVLVGVVLDSLYFSPVLFSEFGIGFFTFSFIFSIFILEKFKSLVQTKNFVPKMVMGVSTGSLFCVVIFLFFN